MAGATTGVPPKETINFDISLACRLSSDSTCSPLKLALGMALFLKPEVRLHVTKLRARACRINAGNHALSPGMRVIRCDTEPIPQRHIQTDVPDIRQAAGAAAGPACIAKCVRLKRAAASVPKVMCVREAEGVEFAAHRERM